jgi:hypothetical protein
MLLPTIPQDDWRWATTPINSGTNEICVKQGEKGALAGFGTSKVSKVAMDKRDWNSLERCIDFIESKCNATFKEDQPHGPVVARVPAHFFRILVSGCAS